MENEEKVVKLSIPDGYEFDHVENGEVILKKKEVVFPKRYDECLRFCDWDSFANWYMNVPTPKEMINPIYALCKLLICRDAWWKQLGWKPDWIESDVKYAIGVFGNVIKTHDTKLTNYILTFPTKEVRDQFFETFRDFIEEAKELL